MPRYVKITELPTSLKLPYDDQECILPIYSVVNGTYSEPVRKISFKNLIKAIKENSADELIFKENKDGSISIKKVIS